MACLQVETVRTFCKQVGKEGVVIFYDFVQTSFVDPKKKFSRTQLRIKIIYKTTLLFNYIEV